MFGSARCSLFVCSLAVVSGCAARHAVPPETVSAGSPSASNIKAASVAPGRASPTALPAAPPAAPGSAPRPAEIVLDGRAPLHPLPELKVDNVGLHIGGGPNDAETKAPFLRAVEARFSDFLDCYRKSEDPGKGGTFGIDLHIARAGGKPHVEQPRTGMRGADFRSCVVSVFENVEFDKPKHGPTVISYSLRFTLDEH
jgi:hypothetical protein